MDEVWKLALTSLLPRLPFQPEDKPSTELRAFLQGSGSDSDAAAAAFINLEQRTQNLRKILDSLLLLHEDNFTNSKPTEWALLFVLLGEQHESSVPWSSAENSRLCTEIIQILNTKLLGNCSKNGDSFEGLFDQDFKQGIGYQTNIFGCVLKLLKAKLRTDEWRFYPAAVVSFQWILKQIKYPHLSEYVETILPPSLLFTDDFADSNKLIGIDCILHCLNNLNKADLQRNQWGLVLHDVLTKLIHVKKPEIIQKLGPALLKTLNILEEDPNRNSDRFTKYDQTLKQILFTLEFATEHKKVWLPNLIEFMRTMGHATLHYSNRISSMLLDFATSNDPELWILILETVEVCIQNTWLKPSSTNYAEIILRIAFNHSMLITEDNTRANWSEKLLEKIHLCFEMLSQCDDFDETRVQIQELLDSDKNKILNQTFVSDLDKYLSRDLYNSENKREVL